MRGAGECCSRCRFYEAQQSDSNVIAGYCLRYPPAISSMTSSEPTRDRYPAVQASEWCGEFDYDHTRL